MVIAIVILCAALGVAVTVAVMSRARCKTLRLETVALKGQADALRDSLATATAETAAERSRASLLEQQQQTMLDDRFRMLASQVLSGNVETLRQSHLSALDETLKPLKEDITAFKRTVTESYATEQRENFSLREKISELATLNRSLELQTKDLASALRGNTRVQGMWGEIVLETLLEKAGLRRDEEFSVQKTISADNSKLRPDVVVYYPDGRAVPIDSKVSLTPYLNLIESHDPREQKEQEKLLVNSVRRHMDTLAKKDYQSRIDADGQEFVLMFIPNEGAYIAAMRADSTLWDEAWGKRVLIVSPTHLIAALRMVAQMWQRDRRNRNAMEIAVEAGKMYDKLVGFISDMQDLERQMKAAANSLNDAMKKLSEGRGNLLSKAEKVKQMGARTTKSIPMDFDRDDIPKED